jgi:transcriptional regulator with XRE-family HTH domain
MSSEEEIYKQLGQSIKSEREKAKVTQEELAQRIGLKRTSITNIEGGRQKVQLHTLYSIASVLNVLPERLLPPASAPMRLVCYVCGFDMEKAYGPRTKDVPGLFYLKAISKKGISPEGGSVVLCANCKFRSESKPELSLEELRQRIAAQI